MREVTRIGSWRNATEVNHKNVDLQNEGFHLSTFLIFPVPKLRSKVNEIPVKESQPGLLRSFFSGICRYLSCILYKVVESKLDLCLCSWTAFCNFIGQLLFMNLLKGIPEQRGVQLALLQTQFLLKVATKLRQYIDKFSEPNFSHNH